MAKMTNTQISKQILDAIAVISKRAVELQPTDKTIQATIVSCIDPTIGKYKVKYQDGYWYAYSSNVNNTYNNGSDVYVLIPNGDMTKDKIIVGSTKKLGINYINIEQDGNNYTINGRNLLTFIEGADPIVLSSSKPSQTKTLYKSSNLGNNSIQLIGTKKDTNNKLTQDYTEINQYISNSKYLILSMYIKTSLAAKQRSQGNYGIKLTLSFAEKDDSRKTVKRTYIFDVDNMVGQPYNFTSKTYQNFIFEIDNVNFKKIESIQAFCENFSEADDNKDLSKDISIYNLSLVPAEMLTQSEKDGVKLELVARSGYMINTNKNEGIQERPIQAQVKVQMKVIDNNTQKLPFYWFVEDVSIFENNLWYCNYGGRGWKCLNDYNITSGTVANPKTIQYLPGSYKYTIKSSQIYGKKQKYKCVVIYDKVVLSKEFEITNLGTNKVFQLVIKSDLGSEFTNDRGKPSLVCTFANLNASDIQNFSKYKFYWSRTDAFNQSESLKSNSDEKDTKKGDKITQVGTYTNEFLFYVKNMIQLIRKKDSSITKKFSYDQKLSHQQILTLFKILMNNIDVPIKYEAGFSSKITISEDKDNIRFKQFCTNVLGYSISNLKDLTINSILNKLKNFNTNTNQEKYVYRNNIKNIPVKQIVGFNTYKCTVKDSDNVLIGTASITLKNNTEKDSDYILYINNGDQVFNYNEDGVAPTSDNTNNSVTIKSLSFIFIDNNNQQIAKDTKNLSWVWQIPKNDTMLLPSSKNLSTSLDGNFYEESNSEQLSFGILKKYAVNKNNNIIKLIVTYKKMKFTAETNFLFLKQGDPGTNGTEYVLRIKKLDGNNNLIEDQNQYLTYYAYLNDKEKNQKEEDRTIISSFLPNKYLEPYLYRNDEVIKDKTTSWSILSYNKKNKNTFFGFVSQTDTKAVCQLKVTNPKKLINNFLDNINDKINNPQNIIKCNFYYNNKNYYNTVPVLTSYCDQPNYRLRLKTNTGFTNVIYKPDGTNPSYDNKNPFEIILQKKEDGVWYDITKQTIVEVYQNKDYTNQQYWSKGWTGGISTGTAKIVWTSVGQQDSFLTTPKSQNNDLEPYQRAYKPKYEYKSTATNIAILAMVKYNLGNSNIVKLFLHIPIHFLLNQYGNAALNGWDGNAVELGNDNGVILAPQIGAGKKDSKNTFTGVVMGVEQQADRSARTGLFGYYQGKQSIFLNAENGSATFGLAGSGGGQIIIDPSSSGAYIQSGDYEYKDDTGTGMQINFSSQGNGPWIRFGSKNFEVNSKGYLTAKGGGQIAGWKISDTELLSSSTKPNVGMNSSNAIELESAGRKVEQKNDNSINGKAAAFWAGGTRTSDNKKFILKNPNFCVTQDGYLKATQATIGAGTSDYIHIGKGSKTDKNLNYPSAIFSGGKNAKDAISNGFYLGTDGLGIGKVVNKKPIGVMEDNNEEEEIPVKFEEVSAFQVNNTGTFYAREGYIGNGANGNCWEVKNNKIFYKKNTLSSSSQGVYIGPNGISLGVSEDGQRPGFKVNSQGAMSAERGTIAGWIISRDAIRTKEDGKYSPNKFVSLNPKDYKNTEDYDAALKSLGKRKVNGKTQQGKTIYLGQGGLRIGTGFHVSNQGDLYAISGTIGGATISENTLKGLNWSINNKSGKAAFSDISITGGRMTGTTIGGSSRNGDTVVTIDVNTNISSGAYIGGKTVTEYIQAEAISAAQAEIGNLDVSHLFVGTSFTFNNVTLLWKSFFYINQDDITCTKDPTTGFVTNVNVGRGTAITVLAK